MSQQVQELIDKIKQEGLEAAEHQARQIAENAETQAREIIAAAEKKAAHIVAAAETRAEKIQESARAAIQQASRDTLIFLRQKIQNLLQQVVDAKVDAALTPDHLARIIEDLVKNVLKESTSPSDTVVTVSPADLDKLRQSTLMKLQESLKSGIALKSSGELGGGFLISFDKGKSSFDFSDQSLADYLSSFLSTGIADIVKDAV